MQAGANFYYFMQQWCNIINPHAQKAIFHHPIIVLPDSANIAHNYTLWNIMDIFLAVQQSLEGQVLFCLLVMTAAHDFTLAPCHNVVYVCSYSERVRTCQCLRMRFVGINTYVQWQSSVFGAEIGVVVADSGGRIAGMSGMIYLVRSVSLPHWLLVGMV